MTPLEFLQAVWPSEGHYCLALPFVTSDGAKAYRHKVFPTIEAAAQVAASLASTTDVFFCVHTLLEPRRADPTKPKGYVVRAQANTKAAKAFFFDLDVGEGDGKYASQAEALKGVRDFCKAAELPKPLITSSGGGLHLYWPLHTPIVTSEWRETAAKLRAVAKHYGLRYDPSRTVDSSSVLRVVGTNNHKQSGNPRPVTALTEGRSTPTGVFTKLVDDAVIRTGVIVRQNPVYQAAAHPLLGSNIENVYDGPPVAMKALLTACGQVRHLFENREKIGNTDWYHGVNVIRFVDKGRTWVERFSAEHRHDRIAAKIAQMEAGNYGPASCQTLMELEYADDEICARCPFAGRVKNPLMAARFKDEAPQPTVVEYVGPSVVTTEVPPPPKPYTRLKSGAVAVCTKNKDGDEVHVVIYEHDLHPVRRLVNSASGTEQQMWRVMLPREGAKDFILDADALYDKRKFSLTIANQGIYPAASNIQHLQDYMTAYITELQKLTDAEAQCNHLGWNDDHTGFIFPDKIMRNDGTAKPAMLSVGAARSSAYVVKQGSMQRQIELLKFYNHPAYLPQQFMVLAGLAAPIFHMTGHAGVIVNASGEAGASKSTSLYTAASLWGHPKLYPINGTANGATARGRMERVTVLGNYPVCVDEITHIPVKEANDLAMGITQPGHRIRLDTTGTERAAPGGQKATMMLCTANSSLHGLLSTDNTAGTAGSMRVFEIVFRPGIAHKKHEADDYLRDICENYGHIGEPFIAYVLQNYNTVEKRLREVMREVDERAHITGAERFWSAAIAAVIVAGEIATQLGLVTFDTKELLEWAIEKQIPVMRGIVREEYSTPLGVLTEYLAQINGNVIVVNKINGNNLYTGSTNVIAPPHGKLLAHYDVGERVMWVLKKGFKDYCVKVGANSLKVLEELSELKIDEHGHSNRIIANKHIRKVMGAGTEHAKAQSWCFTVNMGHPDISGTVDLTVLEGGGEGDKRPTSNLKVVG